MQIDTYDVFNGCHIDPNKVEAHFDMEDQEEAYRLYNLLESVPASEVSKNWN